MQDRDAPLVVPEQDSSPLSQAILDELRCDLGASEGDAVLIDLLRIFLHSARAHVANIEALARQRETAAVAFEAHGLKGAAGTMGAVRLAELARELEAAACALAPAGVEALVAALKAEFQRVAAWCAEQFPESKESLGPLPLAAP